MTVRGLDTPPLEPLFILTTLGALLTQVLLRFMDARVEELPQRFLGPSLTCST
jgi:hypothetical protein